MNKPIKIILLVVAILLAVGGVMAYYKTIVSPPGKLVFNNQYINSDKKNISLVKSANTDSAMDSVYVAITHELDLQLANSFLTNQERDELLQHSMLPLMFLFVNPNLVNPFGTKENCRKSILAFLNYMDS